MCHCRKELRPLRSPMRCSGRICEHLCFQRLLFSNRKFADAIATRPRPGGSTRSHTVADDRIRQPARGDVSPLHPVRSTEKPSTASSITYLGQADAAQPASCMAVSCESAQPPATPARRALHEPDDFRCRLPESRFPLRQFFLRNVDLWSFYRTSNTSATSPFEAGRSGRLARRPSTLCRPTRPPCRTRRAEHQAIAEPPCPPD